MAFAVPLASAPAGTALLDPRRWWALPFILVGSFLAFLDFFIVNSWFCSSSSTAWAKASCSHR